MARIAFGLLGGVVALFPDRILDTYERFALEHPDECDAHGWLVSAIRAEGVLVALLSLLGGRAFAAYVGATGLVGLLALFFPERYAKAGFEIAYEDADAIEWRDGYLTGVRLLGAAAVLVSLLVLTAGRGEDERSTSG